MKRISLLLIITLSNCSVIAKKTQEATIEFPQKWVGYYTPAPKPAGSIDIFREYFKIESMYLYLKEVSPNFETGEMDSMNGNVYRIIEIKKK